jgi:hypothetical protein
MGIVSCVPGIGAEQDFAIKDDVLIFPIGDGLDRELAGLVMGRTDVEVVIGFTQHL